MACKPIRWRPRWPDNAELRKVGVELTNRWKVEMKCLWCGQSWTPNFLPNGRLPRGYWQCPNGCNKEPDEFGWRFVGEALELMQKKNPLEEIRARWEKMNFSSKLLLCRLWSLFGCTPWSEKRQSLARLIPKVGSNEVFNVYPQGTAGVSP